MAAVFFKNIFFLFSGLLEVSCKGAAHFCAIASSPLGRMRLKGSPPTPAKPKPAQTPCAFTSEEEAGPLEEAAELRGPQEISGRGSLAGGADPGLVGDVLADVGLVGVVGVVRPRLARASKVPSGSTITSITETWRRSGKFSVCVT